jgi:hypothetical protein
MWLRVPVVVWAEAINVEVAQRDDQVRREVRGSRGDGRCPQPAGAPDTHEHH